MCCLGCQTGLVQRGTASSPLPFRPAPHDLPACTSSCAHPNFCPRSEERREVVLCCRGTFSPEDAFVDLLATGVQRVWTMRAASIGCDEQLEPATKHISGPDGHRHWN